MRLDINIYSNNNKFIDKVFIYKDITLALAPTASSIIDCLRSNLLLKSTYSLLVKLGVEGYSFLAPALYGSICFMYFT